MKINRIEIYGFGKWNNITFDLKQGLQVFYGLNEAGKSTLRQFIYSVLFGFATGKGGNKYLRYIPKKGKKSAAYGGVLEIEYQKHLYAVERTKGKNGGTVSIKNLDTGITMPPEFLSEILGPVDQKTYERLLGFNQSDLDDFNDLSNRDDLRRHILRMGAVGSDEWIKLEQSLKKEANEMYTVSSRTRQLDRKIKEYEQAQKKLQEDKDRFPDYQSIQELQKKSEQHLKEVRDQINILSNQLAETTSLLNNWDNYAEIRQIREALKDVPTQYLKLDLNELEILLNQIKATRSEIKKLKHELSELKLANEEQDDAEKLVQLQGRLPEVKLNYGQVEDLNKRIQRLLDQSRMIEKQYNQDLSGVHPMTEKEFNEFKELALKEKRVNADINQIKNQMLETAPSRRSKASNPSANMVLGLAAILSIIDFLLPLNVYIKVVILAIIIVAGYVTVKTPKTTSAPAASLSDLLEENEANLDKIKKDIFSIGQQTGFGSFSREDWSVLQNDLQNYQHQLKEVDELKQKLNKTTTQIENFWQFSQQVVVMPQTRSKEAIAPLTNQIAKLVQAANLQRENVQKSEILNKNLQDQQVLLKKLESDPKLLIMSGVDEDSDQWIEEVRTKQNLYLRLTALENSLSAALTQKLEQYKDSAMLRESQSSQESKLAELKQTENQILDERADQIGKLSGLKNSVDILNEQQQLSELQTELKELIANWLTLQLGAKWVDQTLSIATKGRLPIIMEEANRYFNQITNGRYSKIEFDKDDMINVTDKHGETFEIAELSKGTMEQLYISIRFAFMKSFSDTVQLPIIIDDAFVAFDDIRIKQIFDLLKSIADQNQVIYFTAKKEVYNLTDDRDIVDLNTK
ncbi:DNA repair protein [Pediococcus stilesii]|uniref:DNA repair protein n=1 Tax=Pediococcus stilesii TaxID=331679 RepID=A0A5R9BUI9_9LACO|nr:AAA family ATPase [Pediococcus stilesii]TLQ03923.1 DNA repair protein [Pediococcus stilesii]